MTENYFELYRLPESFYPDPVQVKAKYYELSRLYHPDRYANADNTEKLQVLTMAALNNKAYKTLNSPDATVAYILRLNKMLEDEEKYTLPSDFLMDMMDLNEAVSEYEDDPESETAQEQAIGTLNQLMADWEDQAGELMQAYNPDQKSHDLLLKIKYMYFRKKYLLCIQERIDKFAARWKRLAV